MSLKSVLLTRQGKHVIKKHIQNAKDVHMRLQGIEFGYICRIQTFMRVLDKVLTVRWHYKSHYIESEYSDFWIICAWIMFRQWVWDKINMSWSISLMWMRLWVLSPMTVSIPPQKTWESLAPQCRNINGDD